jgi:cytidylate kinase
MYRALTVKALDAGIDPSDGDALTTLAERTSIEFGPDGLLVDGHQVGREIRTPRVSAAVSAVSAHPGVRRELVRHQREILSKGNAVGEGRDIGTVVCPDAAVKIFLTASIDERARRRHREMSDGGDVVELPALKDEIERRDQLDSSRTVSPLIPAEDAVVLDTSTLTPRQVVDKVLALVHERMHP